MRFLSAFVLPRRRIIFSFSQFQSNSIRRVSISPIQIPMDATEQSLRQSLSEKSSSVETQGDAVRALKASRAAKSEIDAAIELLNKLKLEKSDVEKQLQSTISSSSGNGSLNREAFRQAVVNTLERRLFYMPSFKIYRGVAGLFDYGPPGCAVKANVLSLWRQHFIEEEKMLEVDCSNVTPEVVLKTSGHVDKFTDLMVKDEKTGTCFRADHLLKDYCTEKLEKDLTISAEKAAELKDVVAVMEDYSPEELGAKIKEYGITAPDTQNPLSDPYPFNLMFQTSIGPSGGNTGYMRPETAQGIFVNFKELYDYNKRKLPFAAAQIGQACRNEIAPRQGPVRVREFTMAEIEHFVDPENKAHPKFSDVSNLEFLMFPRDEQMSGQSAKKLCLGEAVAKGTVDNETLGYFIGRVYLFLTRLGIDKERLRFRQHLANEMAHYAADCWDAEIECSYGWIECVGIADRSAYDLRAHSEKSGVALVAEEKYAEPKEVEKLVITPVMKELDLAFKGNQKHVVESLEAMNEKEAMEMKATLESKGELEFYVCTLGKNVNIKKNMVSISKEKKKEHQRVFTPSVIEPSFGIGRIMYCLYEHCFSTSPSKAGDEQLNVFRFPPLVAPFKCRVFPLVQNQQFEEATKNISKELTSFGIYNKIDITGTTIGKKYARTDELGVPFAITVDSETSVTIRERDSKDQVRVSLEEAAFVVILVAEGMITWQDVWASFPHHSVEAQRNAVRAASPKIDAAIENLKKSKVEKSAVVNTLERSLVYIPSFQIHGDFDGFFDYGPSGSAIKSNVLSLWRQHFILEEQMLEVDSSCVTPEIVLKASGHVDEFTVLVVKDVKTGTCYRAEHLLKDYCNEMLEKELTISAEKAVEMKNVLAVMEGLSPEELGSKLKEYGITAPDTKNPLSDPYPYNLMFKTSIGPSGGNTGYLRPETAQGIFVNFNNLHYYNGRKLPFAAAQIGQAFRNEISPREGPLGACEFTLAEIEHFVDPENKSHPKFSDVAELEILIFPREEQMSGLSAKGPCLGEAVAKGTVSDESLGYFIGRVYLFLTRIGIDKERLRFRQHLADEVAHYAADCWDAEIETSSGWVACVEIADRSTYDLRAHSEKSGVALVAEEKYAEPKEVEKLVVTPVKKELGLAFKGNQKDVVEALEAMNEQEAMEMKATLESKGEVEFKVCSLGKNVSIKKNMVSISRQKKKEHQRVFTPSVIGLSFKIGRIIYCLYEHIVAA